MYNAHVIVPDTSLDPSVQAKQLQSDDDNIQGYMSLQVVSGPDVFCLWRLGDAGIPSAADVLERGFSVGSLGSPISVQDPASPANPARLYLATVSGEADFRAFA